ELTLGESYYRAFDLFGGLLANDPSLSGISYWAVGTGDPAWDQTPPPADTTLTRLRNEIFRKPIDPAFQTTYAPATRTLEVQGEFGPDEAAGALREFGL